MENTCSQKRIYGPLTNARFLFAFLMNTDDLRAAKRAGSVGEAFEKRIMLAVTEVNGCEMCRYFHTQQALKLGMDREEIDAILCGELSDVPDDEITAILFAQHYADMAGRPNIDAWQRMVGEYGYANAVHIRGYIRAIMVGNAQGNITGAMKSRFHGRPEKNSSFIKEISVLVMDVVLIPGILLGSIVSWPIRRVYKRACAKNDEKCHNT